MKYTTKIIRTMFLNFFKNHQHKIISGSSLIPQKNSNLLFTNAGMNQFQDVFLGKKKYPFSQVATIQKCLRTGGKHNDFHEVGNSLYHNTFFEMLGNFSFGAYCKKQAILYAWTLLTDLKWFNIPQEKLFVTVYYEDHETYNIWSKNIQLPETDIIKIYDKKKKYESDNFWQMGETGPCGPCTEIFFKKKNQNNENYDLNNKNQCIEIWNIVFIQFNRISNSKIIPLDTISIDTGMGLERIASILQNVSSNYQIDIFKKIINYICQKNNLQIKNNQSLNIISDHIRAAVFIINEKIIPSNEGRGYILRRIIRRALLHGSKLGIKNNFLCQLVDIIIETEIEQKKNLKNNKKYIINILQEEEIQFNTTLKNGLNFLNKHIQTLKTEYIHHEIVFYLYDTLGFPIDLTQEVCQENNIIIKKEELNSFILKIKKQRKKENKKKIINNIIYTDYISKFCGYKTYETTTTIKKIFINSESKKSISPSETGILILNQTPFFGESGGQIGDTGIISNNGAIFYVHDTQYFSNAIGHIGTLSSGKMHIHETVHAKINIKKRLFLQNNHTTTHLLHAALQKILQYPIKQKGSFINEKYLRFDFTYPHKITNSVIFEIEVLINQYIQQNVKIQENNINFETAQNENYIFLKHKKYPPIVRTISIKNISKEICKGTHANQTGEVGLVRIISYKNIASGIKRIEIITGINAIKTIHQQDQTIHKIQNILGTDNTTLIPKIKKIMKYQNHLEKENHYLNQILILYQKKKIIKKIKTIKTINYVIYKVNILNITTLKNLIKQLKSYINSGIIILFYKNHEKHVFIINITKNLIQKIQTNQIITIIKKYGETVGGGKPELGQCIIKNVDTITNIIENIESWIIHQIQYNISPKL